jgi:hypothetical protein
MPDLRYIWRLILLVVRWVNQHHELAELWSAVIATAIAVLSALGFLCVKAYKAVRYLIRWFYPKKVDSTGTELSFDLDSEDDSLLTLIKSKDDPLRSLWTAPTPYKRKKRTRP